MLLWLLNDMNLLIIMLDLRFHIATRFQRAVDNVWLSLIVYWENWAGNYSSFILKLCRRNRRTELWGSATDFKPFAYLYRDQDRAVGVVTRLRAGWLGEQGLIPGMGKRCFSSLQHWGLGSNQPPLKWVSEAQ
jgi:hypothetical protein